MAPEEAPLRCLAVRVMLDEAGEIDGLELEVFMNDVAGPHQWLSTTEWLFKSPPAEAAGEITVPVVVRPEAPRPKSLSLGTLVQGCGQCSPH